MNFMQFSRLALPILLCGFFIQASAQTDKTNHPFSWKESTDPWYMSKAYTFKYADDLTAKGLTTKKGATDRGPVCTKACNETTAPGACTETLMRDKFKDIELSGFNLPRGYSGVEYVTFEVQTNGNVSNYQVVKQPIMCKPCIQQAVNLVASLDEWYPAIQDGIRVKSTVLVPVYFRR
ncbi:MAG: energy transducer TonB [Saprospiraceae bacterium]|nr:energy transducer TonB [Saprospiraceae bacterium]